MRYAVPQFIDIKEKIFGPMTLVQFLYVGGAAGLSFAFYKLFSFTLFIVLSFPILALGISLAFLKYNGRPLSQLIKSAFFMFTRPRVRVWKRAMIEDKAKKKDKVQKTESAVGSAVKELPDKSSLEKISYLLDTEGGALMHKEDVKIDSEKESESNLPSEMTAEQRADKLRKLLQGL